MNSNDSRRSGGRSGRGSRRSSSRPRYESRGESRAPQAPAPKSLWQKIVSFFRPNGKPAESNKPRADRPVYQPRNPVEPRERQPERKPEIIDVTTPKLYVGNLSFDASESDLFELFNGVGKVVNAEIVTHKQTERSKGFGFVLMTTVDEAKRAVTELHDKDFMGRKLCVSGSKTPMDRAE